MPLILRERLRPDREFQIFIPLRYMNSEMTVNLKGDYEKGIAAASFSFFTKRYSE